MLSSADIRHIWPGNKRAQQAVVLAQELSRFTKLKKCGGCTDHDNMEIPTKDCCVYDIAYTMLRRLDELN
jgi:hypothetical protein